MSRPVGAHALLSDCNGAALVDDRGSVVWWCAPRFDSPSAFSALLDPSAGVLSLVRSEETWSCTRRYLDGTLVLETELRRGDCVLRVTDCLATGPNERGLSLGSEVPHALVRVVECLGGACRLHVQVVPRFEYGLTVPRTVATARGPETVGGCERMFVDALDLDWTVEDTRAVARPSLRAGDRFELVLRRRPGIERNGRRRWTPAPRWPTPSRRGGRGRRSTAGTRGRSPTRSGSPPACCRG